MRIHALALLLSNFIFCVKVLSLKCGSEKILRARCFDELNNSTDVPLQKNIVIVGSPAWLQRVQVSSS